MSHIISTPRTENPTPRSSIRRHSTPRHGTRQWSERSLGSTLREIVLMATMFMLYRQVRHLTSGDVDQAMVNADRVVGLERSLGAFNEVSLQRLVLNSRMAIEFLDHYYVFVHFTASFGFMAWVFLRHPESWGRIRSWFMSVTVAGLVIHVLFPLAPPRMLADEGFVDTLHVYGPSIYSQDVTNSAANQLAAMPSLHFAWAAIVAAGVISMRRSRWTWLIVVHPIVTLLAIVATANHYWVDAAVGGILVAAAVSVTYLVKRPTPAFARMPAAAHAPAFRPLPAFASLPASTFTPSRAAFALSTTVMPSTVMPSTVMPSTVMPSTEMRWSGVPALSFARVPTPVRAPAYVFSSAFASAARFAQGPVSVPLVASLPAPPRAEPATRRTLDPALEPAVVTWGVLTSAFEPTLVTSAVEPTLVTSAVEPVVVASGVPAARLRISRVSTITAVPVIARETPGGRRHDLSVRRSRSARVERCLAAGDLQSLGERSKARSICLVTQIGDSQPV